MGAGRAPHEPELVERLVDVGERRGAESEHVVGERTSIERVARGRLGSVFEEEGGQGSRGGPHRSQRTPGPCVDIGGQHPFEFRDQWTHGRRDRCSKGLRIDARGRTERPPTHPFGQ